MQPNLLPYSARSGNPFTNDQVYSFGMAGYATVSFQIVGTFTSGSYTPQVSNDGGQTWVSINAIDSTKTEVGTITTTGMYRADVNGYELFRLNPASVVGSIQIWSFASPIQLMY